MLLALDTSTEWASVALFDGRDVLGEETWRAQRRHGDELFGAIERRSLTRIGHSPLLSEICGAQGRAES